MNRWEADVPRKQILTDYLRQRVTVQVQQHRPRLETCPELKEAVQRQRGHMRLAPALSSLLHLLFKLYPPAHTHSKGLLYPPRVELLDLKRGHTDVGQL